MNQDELIRENENLKLDLAHAHRVFLDTAKLGLMERDALRAEVERLAKRNDALEEAFKIGKKIDEYHMDRMVEIAELRAYIYEIGKMVGVENWNKSPTDMVVQSAVSMMAHEEKELRARLAAADALAEAIVFAWDGESWSLLGSTWKRIEEALAAYDAAKGGKHG